MDRKAVRSRVDPKAALRSRFESTFRDQERFSSYRWTDREFSLIDQAVAGVEAAIKAGDSTGFDQALARFVRRTTPIEVLVEISGKASGDVALWAQAVTEFAERTGTNETFVIHGCRRLGHQDLVFRVVGEPGEAEFAIEELPALLEAGQGCRRDEDLETFLLGVLDMRAKFGPATRVTEWRPA